jgi:ribose 5-phosphate isomerase B
MARKHNDVNVLTLSGRRLSAEVADAIVATFLDTAFEGGRHEQRVALINQVERR